MPGKTPSKVEATKERFRETMLRLGFPKIANWSFLGKESMILGSQDLDELSNLVYEDTEDCENRSLLPFLLGLAAGVVLASLVAFILFWEFDDDNGNAPVATETPTADATPVAEPVTVNVDVPITIVVDQPTNTPVVVVEKTVQPSPAPTPETSGVVSIGTPVPTAIPTATATVPPPTPQTIYVCEDTGRIFWSHKPSPDECRGEEP